MASFFPSSTISTIIPVTIQAGDYVLVRRNVSITGQDAVAIYGTSYGFVEVLGEVAGQYAIYMSGAAGQTTYIYVGLNAIVSEYYNNAITISTGNFDVTNYGQIIALTTSGGTGVAAYAGGGRLINYGQIVSNGKGYTNSDVASSADASTLINYGTISASQDGVYEYGAHTSTIKNYGTIIGGENSLNISSYATVYNYGVLHGNVRLSGSALLDSTFGSVEGVISSTGFGARMTVIAGNTGNGVAGGPGDDFLYANPTQAAADHAIHTVLDGGQGYNALYGDGAYTVFLAGTADGGRNQIWGAASRMTGVAGYANNTLTLGDSSHGAYVDLLNGHNVYISQSTNWTGSGVFEDSVAAAGKGLSTVPNVEGSRFADVIICDNGVDRITAGIGADSLYAGVGPGSQDTFIFTGNGFNESNLATGYDSIVGFKAGIDKIDVSVFTRLNGLGPSCLAIFTSGLSNTVYVEKTAGVFNASTDMALIVRTAAAGGLRASDFIL